MNKNEQASDAIATIEAIKNTSYEDLNASLWEAYRKSLGGVQTLIKGHQIELEAHAQREVRRLQSPGNSWASTPTRQGSPEVPWSNGNPFTGSPIRDARGGLATRAQKVTAEESRRKR